MPTKNVTKKRGGWGIKHTAKTLVKKAGQMVRGRYTDKKGLNLKNIMSDTLAIKALMNVEKKRIIYSPNGPASLGQVNVNASGHLIEDITPNIAQGVTETTRIGNSIKLFSMYGKLQIRNSGSQNAPVRFRVMIVKVLGEPYTSGNTMISEFLRPNAWVATYNAIDIYDTNSQRDSNNARKFKVLYNRTFKMGGDSVSGMSQQTEHTIKLRHNNYHVKWQTNADTVPTAGQLYMIVLADRGNFGVTSSIQGISDQTTGSGYYVDRYLIHYVIDN